MVNTQLMQKVDLGLHALQGVWGIVVMGVISASMLQEGPASGAAKFMFAMCWLNIPVLLYLTMAPRFPRTKIFAHPYWLIGMNVFYNILWFAAFVAVAVYTNKGIAAGKDKETDENKKKAGGCAVFKAGTGETEKACTLNKSAVGCGVFMWFLWIATALIAGYAAFYFSKHSVSPFEDLTTPSHEIQETTKDAFSGNDEYAPINRHNRHDDYDDDDLESRARSQSAASSHYNSSTYSYGENAHPGRPVSWAAESSPIAPRGDEAHYNYP